MEPLDHFEQELARHFERAPAELHETIHAVLHALHEKRFNEARAELQQAQTLAEASATLADEQADWQAETALAWLLYYFLGGPDLKQADLDQKVELARTLRLDNETLDRLIDQTQHGPD